MTIKIVQGDKIKLFDLDISGILTFCIEDVKMLFLGIERYSI